MLYNNGQFSDGNVLDIVHIQVSTCTFENRSLFQKVNPLYYFSESYWCLLIGRGMAGIAIGAIHFLVPIYINDISTSEHKSMFNCLIQMQFAFGILTQYSLGESLLNI